MSFQQITIMGNLGEDPELRYTQSGKAVANFSVAVNEGTREEPKATWFRVVAWDKTAEVCAEYLNKGSQCLVSGRMQVRKWTDKDGNENTAWELVAGTVRFVGGKKEEQQERGGGRREEKKSSSRRQNRIPDEQSGDPWDEDSAIPF